MKEDNAEIAIMEQQISDLTDQMSRYNDEATQLDQDLEENQSERNVKYRDLRKREETMDQFLDSFQDSKKQEWARCDELQKKIEELAAQMGQSLGMFSKSYNFWSYVFI